MIQRVSNFFDFTVQIKRLTHQVRQQAQIMDMVGEGIWRAQRRGDLEGILLLAVADIVGDVVVGGGC